MSKIIVETYEVTELNDKLELDNSEESQKIVDSLALDGQKKFFNKIDDKPVSVFSYRKMTSEEAHVYSTLCSQHTTIKEYSDGIIPLRVLEIAAFVNETGFIDELEVWHPANGDIKDPVLVGKKKVKNKYGNTDTELYILARWGTVLQPLVELAKYAKDILVTKLKNQYATAKSKLDRDFSIIEAKVDEYLAGRDSTPDIHYYGF
jgi:hypothetical protein